jgi:ribonuclease J
MASGIEMASVFVVTGHQAEPGSILPRMVFNDLYPFKEQDNVIFSCSVIPVPQNIVNRDKLDAELKKRKIRINKREVNFNLLFIYLFIYIEVYLLYLFINI